jgi:hypothetical protein
MTDQNWLVPIARRDQSIDVLAHKGVTGASPLLKPLLVQQFDPTPMGMNQSVSFEFCGNG